MWSTFLLISIFVADALYNYFQISAVRLHDLNSLAYRELIFLFNAAAAFSVRLFHCAKIGVILYISIAVVDLGITSRFSKVETCSKFTVGAFSDLFLVPLHICLIKLRIFQIIINGFAVGSCYSRYIQSCFHTSFDLKAVNSRIDQFRNMLDHTKVLGVKDISASFIFIYRHVLSRSGLFYNGIFPAAWMGTGTLVGVTTCKEVTQQTSSGIGNAHSTMDETFNLHIIRDMRADLLDLS